MAKANAASRSVLTDELTVKVNRSIHVLAAGAWQASAKELVDTVTKVLALFVSITYVMGTLIVNSFLLTLGIRSTTLLSVEYISAGLPLALLFVVAGSTGFFFNRGQQSRRAVVVGLILSIALLGLIMLYITNLEDCPEKRFSQSWGVQCRGR